MVHSLRMEFFLFIMMRHHQRNLVVKAFGCMKRLCIAWVYKLYFFQSVKFTRGEKYKLSSDTKISEGLKKSDTIAIGPGSFNSNLILIKNNRPTCKSYHLFSTVYGHIPSSSQKIIFMFTFII